MSALFFNGLKLLQLTDWPAVLYHFCCCLCCPPKKKKKAIPQTRVCFTRLRFGKLHSLHNDAYNSIERKKMHYLQQILIQKELSIKLHLNSCTTGGYHGPAVLDQRLLESGGRRVALMWPRLRGDCRYWNLRKDFVQIELALSWILSSPRAPSPGLLNLFLYFFFYFSGFPVRRPLLRSSWMVRSQRRMTMMKTSSMLWRRQHLPLRTLQSSIWWALWSVMTW